VPRSSCRIYAANKAPSIPQPQAPMAAKRTCASDHKLEQAAQVFARFVGGACQQRGTVCLSQTSCEHHLLVAGGGRRERRSRQPGWGIDKVKGVESNETETSPPDNSTRAAHHSATPPQVITSRQPRPRSHIRSRPAGSTPPPSHSTAPSQRGPHCAGPCRMLHRPLHHTQVQCCGE
jgi:hypothetical protein